jgi:hypothetical protein
MIAHMFRTLCSLDENEHVEEHLDILQTEHAGMFCLKIVGDNNAIGPIGNVLIHFVVRIDATCNNICC